MDITTLTSYVSYARKNIHPKLSDEAAEELTRGYVELRKAGKFAGSSKKVRLGTSLFFLLCCHSNAYGWSVSCLNSLNLTQVITATPRQIESLIRLSEALARMRFSEWVSESSMQFQFVISYQLIFWFL